MGLSRGNVYYARIISASNCLFGHRGVGKGRCDIWHSATGNWLTRCRYNGTLAEAKLEDGTVSLVTCESLPTEYQHQEEEDRGWVEKWRGRELLKGNFGYKSLSLITAFGLPVETKLVCLESRSINAADNPHVNSYIILPCRISTPQIWGPPSSCPHGVTNRPMLGFTRPSLIAG